MLSPTGTPPARTPPSASTSSAASAPASSATIPAAIARLTADSVIAATVVGREGEAVTLRTDAGPVSLVTRLALEAGAELGLRLRPGPGLGVVIETVDGAPPKDLARPPLAVIRPAPAPIATAQSAPAQSAAPLPATATPPPNAPPATLAAGASLVATVIALAAPDATVATTFGATTSGATLAGATLAGATATGVVPLAVGDRVSFRLAPLAPSVPTAPAGTPASIQSGSSPLSPPLAATPPLAGPPVPVAPIAPTIATVGSNLAAAAAPGGSTPTPGTARPSPVTPGAALSIPTRRATAAATDRPPGSSPTGMASVPAGARPAASAATAPVGATTTPPPSSGSSPAAGVPASPLTPPTAPTAPSPVAGGATATIQATVLATDGTGRTLLATPLGLLRVESPVALAVGERVVLAELIPSARPTAPPATGAPLADIAGDWFALRAVIEALGGTEAAAPLLDRAVPAPGHKLAATALFFLAALRGGDLGGWLGQRTLARLVRAGHGDAVTRLTTDFAQLARTADTPAAGQWQVVVIPILAEGLVRPLRFHIRRHDRDGEDADGEESGTRFVMEFALSRLGALQLDGLVRERHFDLILRSRARVDDDMRRAVTAIFTDGLAAVGYAGRIGFHVARRLPPMPGDAARPPAGVATVA